MVMHFQPLPPRIDGRDRAAEAWSVRQFAQIQLVLEEIMLVTYSTYVARLDAPLTISEPDDFVEVVALAAYVPGGIYELTVSFVCDFVQITDQLHFQVLSAGVPLSPEFIVQAVAANEVVPFSYSLPIDLKEAVVLSLEAQIQGPGQADVTIPAAFLFLKRLQ